MNRFWVAVAAGLGGVVVGLLIARTYAQATVKGDIHDALNAVGLAGGKFESVADALIIPQVG